MVTGDKRAPGPGDYRLTADLRPAVYHPTPSFPGKVFFFLTAS